MFIPKKDKKSNSTKRIDTLIGRNTQINGDLNFSGGIRIDGNVTGNIQALSDSKSLLTLSEHSKVEGELRVPNMILNGEIHGNVYASEYLELAEKVRINGNVYYRAVQMTMGAEVNGLLIKIKDDDEEILTVEHEVVDNNTTFQLEQKNAKNSKS